MMQIDELEPGHSLEDADAMREMLLFGTEPVPLDARVRDLVPWDVLMDEEF